ncbi:to mixed-linked glucanase precursor [Geosmithia morbida]|uniref:To mixed-linked glucanase n=1 Tax=Geosmithia morbida TaxID=1094350 RepID=A0A9P5D7F0_9HYPO|nr:to mixed-linked glucanase precursor [Geosmithia morbida]KAF4124459.1 to mixed-linked glucanase precursor [Geosmithia morbida]
MPSLGAQSSPNAPAPWTDATDSAAAPLPTIICFCALHCPDTCLASHLSRSLGIHELSPGTAGDAHALRDIETFTPQSVPSRTYDHAAMERDPSTPSGSYGRPSAPAPSAASSAIMTPLGPGTPGTEASRNPFGGADTPPSHRQGPGLGTNPFASPDASRPGSSYGSSGSMPQQGGSRRFFHSRRVVKGEVEKPWLARKESKEKWVTILPLVGIAIGLAISGFLIWDGLSGVNKHKYCPVLDDEFGGSLNTDIWTKEVEVGGFGNGEFVQTTGGDENIFTKDGSLIIKATLQDEDKMKTDTVINLLDDGSCTADSWSSCVASTNTTAGNSSVVPPTKSGRINTKKGATVKYGRVEVTAKLPKGDWLWPAIWMMPVEDTYGPWPSSGEIDVMESRGNNWTYAQGGNNIVSSALHWGPDAANDAWWKTNNKRSALRGTYGDGFNTFGLEWSQKYLFTYVNSRLLQVMYTNFDKPMWDRGAFSRATVNASRVVDAWSQTGHDNTPFDQSFYLIINLAVGGTNGWFDDGKSGKPWINDSPNAPKDFWDARAQWQPTWSQPQLEVKRVVMLQQCDGDEEL